MSNGKPFGKVVWNDAHTSTEQYSEMEIDHHPAKIETFGYIIKSDDVGVTIAAEWTGDGYRNVTFIPRAMIEREELLRLSRVRKKKDASVAPPTEG